MATTKLIPGNPRTILQQASLSWVATAGSRENKRVAFNPRIKALIEKVLKPAIMNNVPASYLHHLGVHTSELGAWSQMVCRLSDGRPARSLKLFTAVGQMQQMNIFFGLHEMQFRANGVAHNQPLTVHPPCWLEVGFIPPEHVSAVVVGSLRYHADFVVPDEKWDSFYRWFRGVMDDPKNPDSEFFRETNYKGPLPSLIISSKCGQFLWMFRQEIAGTSPMTWDDKMTLP